MADFNKLLTRAHLLAVVVGASMAEIVQGIYERDAAKLLVAFGFCTLSGFALNETDDLLVQK